MHKNRPPYTSVSSVVKPTILLLAPLTTTAASSEKVNYVSRAEGIVAYCAVLQYQRYSAVMSSLIITMLRMMFVMVPSDGDC